MILGLVYDLVLGAPVTLCRQILDKFTEEIDKERLITEESVKQRLQQLQLMAQDGQMTDEEYEDIEEKLIERLKAIREYQQSLEMQ